MSIPVTFPNVIEIIAIVGSLIIGILALANYWRERSGRLFGLLCLALVLWKSLDFADPELTASAWVDSMGWAMGAFTVALAWHFVVSYTYYGIHEPPLLWSAFYCSGLLLMVIPFIGSLRFSSAFQACFAVNYMVGVSGIVVIAESHFSIHTWPEYGYCAIDVFTCGDDIKSEPAVEYLRRNFKARHYSVMEMKRGLLDLPDVKYKPETEAT